MNKLFIFILIIIILLITSKSKIYSQDNIVGSGFGTNDWTTWNALSSSAGSTYIWSGNANGTGNQFFRFAVNSNPWPHQGPNGCSADAELTVNPKLTLKVNNYVRFYFLII